MKPEPKIGVWMNLKITDYLYKRVKFCGVYLWVLQYFLLLRR